MKSKFWAGAWMIILLVAGCSASTPAATTAPPPTAPLESPVQLTIVPTFPVTEETPLRPGIDCGWNWATHDDPDLQAQVEAAVREASLTGVKVRVSIFGEDCLNQAGEAVSFATLETDFDVVIEVANLTDREEVGNRLADVLVVLAQFGPEATPGPQAGRITVRLESGSESEVLNMGAATGLEAVEKSLRGEELLVFLEGPTF